MNYSFRCRHCHDWHVVDWAEMNRAFECPATQVRSFPPGPAEQPTAFVSSVEWPEDMETAVINLRGFRCTSPGCNRQYHTLLHRMSRRRGGRTSVENLWPVCRKHVEALKEADWRTWDLASATSEMPKPNDA